MTTTVLDDTTPTTVAGSGTAARPHLVHTPVPAPRLVAIELRKMFDTRSGFWLMASIAISALLATAAVIVWAPESDQTYASFASAVGMPMAVILPIVAILSVTSEWSQRSGLTTFTLVPGRGRVMAAKGAAAVLVAVVSMVLALAIGAVGNVVGTAISGADTVWDIDTANIATIVLANVLGLLMGFTLGVVIRSSAGAIVAYFVYSLVLPNLLFALGSVQDWFADVQPWVDFYFASVVLFEDVPTAEQWAQLSTSGLLWLVLPLALGLWRIKHAEVK